MKRRKWKRGQKFSQVTYRAISTPARKTFPADIEGKPWREPPMKYVVLPIPDKPYVQRRLYHDSGQFMIVDHYAGSKVVWESKVYSSRLEVFEAHEFNRVVFVYQCPYTGE
jgi:hypothetical protein